MLRRFMGYSVTVSALGFLVGCIAPTSLDQAINPQPEAKKRAIGEVSFFEHADGAGAVSIHVIDQRPRKVQDLADADPSYNGVLFRLSNPHKLTSARVLALPANGNVYAAAFTGVPSDSGANYFLTVGLYRNIQSPQLASDPGYSELSNKAGEGGSVGFLVTPGQTTTVTVKINAVGDLELDSLSTVIDHANPVFVAGDPDAFVDTNVTALKSPLAQALNLYVLGNSGTATVSTKTLSRDVWPSSPQTATLSFPVPAQFGNYQLCVEESSGSAVLSRRYKVFSVEEPATVSVSLD